MSTGPQPPTQTAHALTPDATWDTTGVVAEPSQSGRPGASADLDGTPGALAPESTGRQGGF